MVERKIFIFLNLAEIEGYRKKMKNNITTKNDGEHGGK